jgi:hypothetical protein
VKSYEVSSEAYFIRASNMITKLSDTDQKIEKFQISLIRKSSISERILRLRSLSKTVIQLSRRAIKRANPELSEKDLQCMFVEYHYGNEIADSLKKYLTDKAINQTGFTG